MKYSEEESNGLKEVAKEAAKAIVLRALSLATSVLILLIVTYIIAFSG